MALAAACYCSLLGLGLGASPVRAQMDFAPPGEGGLDFEPASMDLSTEDEKLGTFFDQVVIPTKARLREIAGKEVDVTKDNFHSLSLECAANAWTVRVYNHATCERWADGVVQHADSC